jgi:hypothetical protein
MGVVKGTVSIIKASTNGTKNFLKQILGDDDDYEKIIDGAKATDVTRMMFFLVLMGLWEMNFLAITNNDSEYVNNILASLIFEKIVDLALTHKEGLESVRTGSIALRKVKLADAAVETVTKVGSKRQLEKTAHAAIASKRFYKGAKTSLQKSTGVGRRSRTEYVGMNLGSVIKGLIGIRIEDIAKPLQDMTEMLQGWDAFDKDKVLTDAQIEELAPHLPLHKRDDTILSKLVSLAGDYNKVVMLSTIADIAEKIKQDIIKKGGDDGGYLAVADNDGEPFYPYLPESEEEGDA